MAAENEQTPKNKTENDVKDSKKIPVARILQFVFIVGIIVCAVILFVQLSNRNKAEKTYEDLQKNTADGIATNGDAIQENEDEVPVVFSEELGVYIPDKDLDWDELREVNDEIYAWIYVPGTEVDYPVLQSQKNGEDYYLNHNLDGSSGYPGCIYTQALNSMDFTDFVTVLYGHNMKDGTMFKSLHNYSDEDFFDTNRYIYIYTPEKTFVYEIFAAVKFNDRNILKNYDMSSENDRADFINDLYGNRDMTDMINKDISVTTDSKIITLSTCLDNSSNNRWLVNGVLLGD
jgi:sortase B